MYDIERIATIIKPKQPMLDWVLQQPDQDEGLSLEEIRQDCSALLIPIFEDEVQATEFIASIYETLFNNELAAWNEDESNWPALRSFEMFTEWFDLEFHSLVYDLLGDDDELEAEAAKNELLQ